jgi:hypothetical protein
LLGWSRRLLCLRSQDVHRYEYSNAKDRGKFPKGMENHVAEIAIGIARAVLPSFISSLIAFTRQMLHRTGRNFVRKTMVSLVVCSSRDLCHGDAPLISRSPAPHIFAKPYIHYE